MKNVNIMRDSSYPVYRRSHEKLTYRRELPKKGGLGQFSDLRG